MDFRTEKSHYFEMAVALHDVKSAAGLKKLDEYLLSRSYISGLVYDLVLFNWLDIVFISEWSVDLVF